MIRRHPSKEQLLAYAENEHKPLAPLSAEIARHAASCAFCTAELNEMRKTLRMMQRAGELERGNDFTSRILLAAQQERKQLNQHTQRRQFWFAVAQSLVYAMLAVIVGTVSFSTVLRHAQQGAEKAAVVSPSHPSRTVADLTPEALHKALNEIQYFANALKPVSGARQSLWEREHRKIADALGYDIAAARAALQRNPGCSRANDAVNASVQRQALTLKKLYLQEGL